MITRTYGATDNETWWAYVKRTGDDIVKYRHALKNIVTSMVQQRYRRSFFGVLWSFFNPLLNLAIMTVVFSLMFSQDPLKFSIYQMSGIVTWTFLSASINSGTQAFIHAEGYLKKLYVPKILFPLVTICNELVNFFFGLLGYYSIGLIFGLHLSRTHLLLPVAMLVLAIFSLGITLILSSITVYFRDISHFVQVILQGFMWFTPIYFKLDFIPEASRHLFSYSPFYYLVTLMRRLIYDNQFPSLAEWLIPIGIALFSLILGLWVLKKCERTLIYRL
ncbi:MAG: ABC transporter permease [Anaerolineae bacterium]|nr:ABC transporter permease [Anaerolineae bacterium]